MGRWSRLTQAIIPLLERIGAAPLSDQARDKLEGFVDDHGLSGTSPPAWMLELLDDVLEARVSKGRRTIPGSYPLGTSGLVNILDDIERGLLPLNIDDCGECVSWPIPSCNVRVVILREGPESCQVVCLESLPEADRERGL